MRGIVNTDLVVWVLIDENGKYDKAAVEHYANVLANAIQVNFQLTAFDKAGITFGAGNEEG